MNNFMALASEQFEFSQAMRRDFHRNPELGFREIRTAGIVAMQLSALDLPVLTGIAETGVVTVINGGKSGPTILLRFDMDALPVNEETGKDYSSIQKGVMHACGHDGHVAIGLAVARILHAIRAQLHGNVKLVFQPAEEGMGGAERMIKEGVLKNPTPNLTLAAHIWNELPVGHLGIVKGPLMAGGDKFRVLLTGRGGHGALPHQTIDPIVAASIIVNGLQTIISRNISPLQNAVISVTLLKAGEAFNVIPQTAELQGTIRAFEPTVRELIHQRFKQLVTGIGESLGCQVDFSITRLTPPVINDVNVTEEVVGHIRQVLPDVQIDDQIRSMVSEDMAFMMEEVSGCYILVGGMNPAEGLIYPHHHPKFDFDEKALIWGAASLAAAVCGLLNQ